MIGELDLAAGPIEQREVRQRAPYNFLVTRRWMLMVPRSREFVEGISINALGYAGGLLVRDEAQMETVRSRGPMDLLCRAAFVE